AADRSLAFVAAYLGSGDEPIALSAALAIGEARAPGSFAALLRAWERPSSRHVAARAGLLLPMALTRSEEGFEFLLAVAAAEDAQEELPLAAVRALRVLRSDGVRRERVEAALAARGDPRLTAAFAE